MRYMCDDCGRPATVALIDRGPNAPADCYYCFTCAQYQRQTGYAFEGVQ